MTPNGMPSIRGEAERIERARDEIAAAAAALADAGFPGLSLGRTQWGQIVAATLLGSRDDSLVPLVEQRKLLAWSCERLGEQGREGLLTALGSLAKLAQLRWMFDEEPFEGGADPLRLVQGALHAYAGVLRGPTDAVAGEARLTPLAFWVLGMIDLRAVDRRLIAPTGLGREQRRRLARRSGWLSMLSGPRIKDLRWLSKPMPDLRSAVGQLVRMTGDDPARTIALRSLRISSDRFDESDAACLLAEFVLDDPGAVWSEMVRLDADAAAVLRRVASISSDRGDVLVVAQRFTVIEPQGFMDALLAYVSAEVGDERNSRWHETEVFRAVKPAWPRAQHVLANVSWRDGAGATPNGTDERPGVAGEFDVLVQDRGVLVDFQAKSARSANWEQRERIANTEALRQHKRLQGRARSTIDLLRDGKDTRASRTLTVDLSEHVVVPITVGTDVVQRYQVGGSKGAGGTPRVLTTLDHLRVVNEFVPSTLRAVYWLDRYAQEFSALCFIDELDFLTAWFRQLLVASERLPLRFLATDPGQTEPAEGGLMLASNSEIEHFLAVSNSLVLAGSTVPAITRILVGEREPIARMLRSAEPIANLLAEPGIQASELYWIFARSLVGNAPDQLQQALDAPSTTILHNGLYPIGFSPVPVRRGEHEVYRLQHVGIVVERQSDGARRLVCVDENLPGLLDRPRFDPARGVAAGDGRGA